MMNGSKIVFLVDALGVPDGIYVATCAREAELYAEGWSVAGTALIYPRLGQEDSRPGSFRPDWPNHT